MSIKYNISERGNPLSPQDLRYYQTDETAHYFYHPDHLGSASWITDSSGKAIQHLQYLPFGETRVDQRATGSNWSTRYSFSAKEKDEESGYGYFGARYYDSDLSIWLSVDPMADKYPSLNAYNYCNNNPIWLVDPDGREFVGVDGEKVEVTRNKGKISVGENASDDLKRMANSINESGSKTASKQFMKLSKSDTKIHFKIQQGDEKDGLMGYHQPHDENGVPLEWEGNEYGKFDGMPAYNKNGTYKEATITLYENVIDQNKGKFNYQDDNKMLNLNNAMVAVFAHEGEHDLNKGDINAIRHRQEGGHNSRNIERSANRILNNVLREIYKR